MKNLLLTTALIMGTATFAHAASHTQIAMQVDNALASMAMEVDIDSLTEDQISALYTTISSSDNASEKRNKIRAQLNDMNVMATDMDDPDVEVRYVAPRSQLISLVRAKETELGIGNVSLRSLSDEQLVALYQLGNGSASASEKMSRAEGIVNQ